MQGAGLGCRVQGVGFGGIGCRVRVQDIGCRVQGAGCRVQGVGYRVQDVGVVGCRVMGAGYSCTGHRMQVVAVAVASFLVNDDDSRVYSRAALAGCSGGRMVTQPAFLSRVVAAQSLSCHGGRSDNFARMRMQ